MKAVAKLKKNRKEFSSDGHGSPTMLGAFCAAGLLKGGELSSVVASRRYLKK